MEYQTGDHLGVLPRNNVELIRRVMARFGLDAGTYVTINPTGGGTYTHLPLGESAPLLGILGACVELQDVASRSDLAVLARYAKDPEEAERCRPCPASTNPAGRPIANGWQLVGGRCSSCWTTSPAATCRSMSTWSCCRPCDLGTTPSPLPRPSQAAAISRSECSMAPPAAATATSTALPPPTTRQHGGQHTVHLCPQADHSPAAGQPARPDDHGRGSTGMAPFRGFLERAAMAEQGVPVGVDALLRLPVRRVTCSTPTS